MKKLRCSLGLHKWLKHWRFYHHNDKSVWFLFVGLGVSFMSLVLLTISGIDMSENYLLGFIGAAALPTIIGGTLAARTDMTHDKTCIYCHTHDFSHSLWQKKENARKATKAYLVESAEKDYYEEKQFLKITKQFLKIT